MAKRYGRNQKRRHIHEIERLERALDLAITGGFARANPDDAKLEDFIGTPMSIDIHDSEDGFTIQRTASIKFIPNGRSDVSVYNYLLLYPYSISWRGVRWIVKNHRSVRPGEPFYDPRTYELDVLEVELQALGDRDDRRPATRPYLPTIDGKLAA